MTYAYDNYVQLPVVDLYDTATMQMAINAARDMYEKGQDQMKDFYKTYGDFMSPFAKDMERYGQMMGGVRDIINNAYAQGIDLLKSPEGRMLLSRVTNSVSPAEFNAMRANAKTGYEYLNQVSKLAAQGKWSKELEDYISSLPGNVAFDDFSTGEHGSWNRMPTEYSTLQEYVHPSFAHLKPHLLTKEEAISRVGAEYDPNAEYTGITKADMERSMRDALPGLAGSPIYGFYREQARKQLEAAGIANPSEELINEQFVQNAITSDQQMMLPLSKNYDRYFKQQNLNLKQQSLAIQRENLKLRRDIAAAKARGDNGGNGTQLNGVSLAQAWYDTAMAKAYSADGITKDWWDMNKNYDQFGQQADKIFHDFGSKQKSISPVNDADLKSYVQKYGSASDKQLVNTWANPGLSGRTKDLTARYNALKRKYTSKINGPKTANEVQEEYRKQFSISMDGESVAKIVGTPMSDSKTVGKIKPGYIDKLYSTDDIISNTSGYRFTHTSDTNKIRQAIKRYGASNTTITSLEEGYGSLRKNTGSFEVMPRVRVTCTDNEGNIVFQSDAYVDIDLGSYKTKGGSYIGDYKTSGGVQQYGSMTNPADAPKFGRYDINGQYNPGYRGPVSLGESTRGFVIEPEKGGTERNFYPDYNRWTGYGAWDTDVTHSRLHVPYSGLATLPTIPEDSGYDLIFDDDYDEE